MVHHTAGVSGKSDVISKYQAPETYQVAESLVLRRIFSICRGEANPDALHQRPIQQSGHAGHGRQMQVPGCSCQWVCERRGLLGSLHAAGARAGELDSWLRLPATAIVVVRSPFLGAL